MNSGWIASLPQARQPYRLYVVLQVDQEGLQQIGRENEIKADLRSIVSVNLTKEDLLYIDIYISINLEKGNLWNGRFN